MANRDVVFIEGLEARAIIGVTEDERRERQVVRLDIEVACDASVPAREDDVRAAVNYRDVARAVLAHVEENRCHLVETLAERVADLVLREFEAPWVRVRVAKPGAVRFSDSVGVVIERGDRGS